MYEHSIKVPRHYKIAANIFKTVSTEGGSVKSLLYDNKLKHFRTDVLYALISKSITHSTDIDKIFEKCSILQKEPRLDPWLAKILTAELLYGKKALPSKSKPELTVLSYKDQFQQYLEENSANLKTEDAPRPRYVRVNTNLLTTSDAIRAFQDEGYKFIRCTSASYDEYLKQIQSLTEFDFTQDYHVKTMFVFAPGTKFHENELYLENKIILQSKSTALAVHLLSPEADGAVLDMCAAPGMKTTQAAAHLRNQGVIYAVERDPRRYETLCELVRRTASLCVRPVHRDVLTITRGEMADVRYILLDPSCSASGMEHTLHGYEDGARLSRLSSLQEKLLKHACNSFPAARRIVYSTCSLFPEENEKVVANVVRNSRTKWRVRDVNDMLKGQWNNFGSGMYGSMGPRCLYARPDTDLTTGFFLAVLDRDINTEDATVEDKTDDKSECEASSKHSKNKKKKQADSHDNTAEFNTVKLDAPTFKKKSKDKKVADHLENNSVNIERRLSVKKIRQMNREIVNGEDSNDDESLNRIKKKKKNKKSKSKDDCEELVAYELEAKCEKIEEGIIKNYSDKKKRKRCKNTDEIDDQRIVSLDLSNENKKKKDNKLKSSDSCVAVHVLADQLEERIDEIVEESSKKHSDKKKRKSDKLMPCENAAQTTKMKNKKNVPNFLVDENVDFEITEPQRKKKKKKDCDES